MPPASAPAPARGSVQLVGGKARLLESGAYAGPDGFGFTLVANGRLLVPAWAIVTVQPTVIGPTDPWRDPLTGWATIPPLSQVRGPIVPVNSNADLSRMSPGVPGTTYVIGGNLTGSVTVSGNGTQAAPIVIRGADDGTNRANFPKWSSSGSTNLTITGNHVYVQKTCWVGATNQPSNGNVYTAGSATRVSIERCWSYGARGSNLYEICAYTTESRDNVRYYRVRYCEHGNPSVLTWGGLHIMQTPGAGSPQFMYFYRNLISDIDASGHSGGFGTSILTVGRGDPSDRADNNGAYYENRLRNFTDLSGGEVFEFKNAGVTLAYNTMETGGAPMSMRFRHGHNCQMIGNLWFDGPQTQRAGIIQVRGTDHVLINNWSVTLPAGAQVTAGSPNGTAPLELYGGNVDALAYPASSGDVASTHRPNAIRCQVGGNRMAVTVGFEPNPPRPPPDPAIAPDHRRTGRRLAPLPQPLVVGRVRRRPGLCRPRADEGAIQRLARLRHAVRREHDGHEPADQERELRPRPHPPVRRRRGDSLPGLPLGRRSEREGVQVVIVAIAGPIAH